MKFSVKHQIVISLLIGFAGGMIFGQWTAHESRHSRWKSGNIRQHMLEKFSRELHLNEEQKTKAAAIFDAKHPQMAAIQSEMKPKFEALRQSTQAELRKILEPGQQKKFDEMNAEMEKRWKDREKFFNS